MKKIVLASGNLGKVREITAMLKEQEINILPQSEFLPSLSPSLPYAYIIEMGILLEFLFCLLKQLN